MLKHNPPLKAGKKYQYCKTQMKRRRTHLKVIKLDVLPDLLNSFSAWDLWNTQEAAHGGWDRHHLQNAGAASSGRLLLGCGSRRPSRVWAVRRSTLGRCLCGRHESSASSKNPRHVSFPLSLSHKLSFFACENEMALFQNQRTLLLWGSRA